ncbi:MAG: hypothetical protein HN929_02005 [Chloroflexi bacterium]|jgi:hypothetical protein|nr:hypothetical protein [Chloroflexota bacterium]
MAGDATQAMDSTSVGLMGGKGMTPEGMAALISNLKALAGNNDTSARIGGDGKVDITYGVPAQKQMAQSLGAQAEAQQANPVSLDGIFNPQTMARLLAGQQASDNFARQIPQDVSRMANEGALRDFYGAQMEQIRNQPNWLVKALMDAALSNHALKQRSTQRIKEIQLGQETTPYQASSLGLKEQEIAALNKRNAIKDNQAVEATQYKRGKDTINILDKKFENDFGMFDGGNYTSENQQKYRIANKIASNMINKNPELGVDDVYNATMPRMEKEYEEMTLLSKGPTRAGYVTTGEDITEATNWLQQLKHIMSRNVAEKQLGEYGYKGTSVTKILDTVYGAKK